MRQIIRRCLTLAAIASRDRCASLSIEVEATGGIFPRRIHSILFRRSQAR
jgi:hypothetical protein